VVNNGRYLILPWVQQPNLASRVLGTNLRRLSNDWQAVYGHPVLLAETFVDQARFRGTCYLASNWVCVGQTKGWSRHGAQYNEHGQPKAVFVYPLQRNALRRLRAPLAAPDTTGGDKTMTLDVDKLPLDGEGRAVQRARDLDRPPQTARDSTFAAECPGAGDMCGTGWTTCLHCHRGMGTRSAQGGARPAGLQVPPSAQ